MTRLTQLVPPARGGAVVIGLVLLVVAVWLLGQVFWTLLSIAAIAGLVAATCIVAWRDAVMLLGRGDPRPWLVRIREHPWRPVATPVGDVPRPAAYLVLVASWWWLLS